MDPKVKGAVWLRKDGESLSFDGVRDVVLLGDCDSGIRIGLHADCITVLAPIGEKLVLEIEGNVLVIRKAEI